MEPVGYGVLDQGMQPGDLHKAIQELNVDKIRQLVQQDPHVVEEAKTSIFSILNHPDAMSLLFGGTAGAALALSVAKYEKLDKVSQTLLGLAGFGLGSVLIQHLGQSQKHLVSYEPGIGHHVALK